MFKVRIFLFLFFALSFSYLTFIGLQTAIDYDFHETTVAILPFSLAVYYLLTQKYLLYAVFATVAAFTKEDMPLFISMLGLLAILKLKKKRIGLITLFCGISLYIIITQYGIPFFGNSVASSTTS